LTTPEPATTSISVEYDPSRFTGRLIIEGSPSAPIWERLHARTIGDPDGHAKEKELELPWTSVLGILRDFGSKQQQIALGFRFHLKGEAARLATQFAAEIRKAREARDTAPRIFNSGEIEAKLKSCGFLRRTLRPFQIRDLEILSSLSHGANFSVPGSGKTTVTLALHLLVRKEGEHLFVVCPKSAFLAWNTVVGECIDPNAPNAQAEEFTALDGSVRENEARLQSGATRFLMSYDLMIRQQQMLYAYFARTAVHVVLDEAHRMKAGFDSQRGAFLLNAAPFITRRDILTGTPMPQGPEDMASQLGFLWPGHGFDLKIQRGDAPQGVLGHLYVRTTKKELGLPKATRIFKEVGMLPGQLALYGVVRSETLRQLTTALKGNRGTIDFLGARKSIMRLLQLSVNPLLAVKGITRDIVGLNSGILETVMEEGPSSKMRVVADRARELAKDGRKVVIWTIFTETLATLEKMLADLNPVSIYGAIPVGAPTDPDTREWRLKKFHEDPACMVLIANPAAAGEGISLHMVCHDALYLDRSYVSTHYLQSIDRIHRLGLPAEVKTNIEIYRTKAPAGLGSIDFSVSRRLATKIRALQVLLDDTDLHEIAFDEESADDPIDYSVELQDLVDLVEELEGKHGAEEALG
jgi:SNF2 family DNA or RNA helicase